ncbi:MAG: hypothetical protein WB630_00755 [Candidatus Acidiferrales bacterium]
MLRSANVMEAIAGLTRRAGLKVPRQIVVIGFGLIPYAGQLSKKLTSVFHIDAVLSKMDVTELVAKVKNLLPNN